MYPLELQKLIELFKKLPGVGNKTAERYALLVLEMEEAEVEEFAEGLLDAKRKITECEICGNYTNGKHCDICLDAQRDESVICVVSSARDILAIEKLNSFQGRYHVLGGLISTVNNVMPNDLNIDKLLLRLNDEVKELILAFSPTLEGETTALYLSKKVDESVVISHLAQGLPMGGQLEYADEMTLLRSFENRKKV
ncbi:MAG: recombination protein RecR [Erysipelothrix sp.]|nr:recombination protein RecR [Erysipelothrix sp.]